MSQEESEKNGNKVVKNKKLLKGLINKGCNDIC